MSVAAYPSDKIRSRGRDDDALAAVRVIGGAAVSFNADAGTSRIASLAEYGGYRLKFPASLGGAVEAAMVNTGGGVAGGDRVRFEVAAGADSRVTIATATAERVYRSHGQVSDFDVRLSADRSATLAWLPQATILCNGARIRRRFEIELAVEARFLMAETTIFGREASGEVMGEGLLHDVWRVRRGGQLVFAEATRLDGDIASLLARPAVADGIRGMTLLLCVAPAIEEKRAALRDALADCDALAGVSAWNGLLVMRALDSRLEALQSVLRRAIDALQICSIPQVWAR